MLQAVTMVTCICFACVAATCLTSPALEKIRSVWVLVISITPLCLATGACIPFFVGLAYVWTLRFGAVDCSKNTMGFVAFVAVMGALTVIACMGSIAFEVDSYSRNRTAQDNCSI